MGNNPIGPAARGIDEVPDKWLRLAIKDRRSLLPSRRRVAHAACLELISRLEADLGFRRKTLGEVLREYWPNDE